MGAAAPASPGRPFPPRGRLHRLADPRALAERYRPLARRIVREWVFPRGHEDGNPRSAPLAFLYDDLLSEAYLALVQAARRCAPGRAFGPYAARTIRFRLASYLRRDAAPVCRMPEVNRQRRPTTPAPFSEADRLHFDAPRVVRRLVDAPDDAAHVALREAIGALPFADRRLLELRFWRSRTWAEIGRALGLDEERARTRGRRLVRRLKDALAPRFGVNSR